MSEELRLMCMLAHPDDETLGMGGPLARYAAEGVGTYVVTATRGEHGWPDPAQPYPGPTELGRIREAELHAAAAVLGIREVQLLDYEDGQLAMADPAPAVASLVAHVRRVRPQVVTTFAPDGAYGHPDHIAISQLALTATYCALDPAYRPELGPPHRVAKFYYWVAYQAEMMEYQAIFGRLSMLVDGVERSSPGWPEWQVTTWIETVAYRPQVWRAVACHRTQMPAYGQLAERLADPACELWRRQAFYRAFSTVNGGGALEDDLFAGLRPQ